MIFWNAIPKRRNAEMRRSDPEEQCVLKEINPAEKTAREIVRSFGFERHTVDIGHGRVQE